MDKIRFSDINFTTLEKLQQQGNTSTIYKDGNTCFKILNGLYEREKEDLYDKLIDMEGISIPNVILPKQLIIKDNRLVGYTMDYFKDSITLSDCFSSRYVDSKKLFAYVSRASKILKDIHEEDIICQDLSFENILVDKNGNVVFCDLVDNCSYRDYYSNFVSTLIRNFIMYYRGESLYPYLSKNLDRISMIVSLFYLIYNKELNQISNSEYSSLSNKSVTLDNLRPFANMLLDKSNRIGKVPYLDELVDSKDDYIIDRKKQISFVKRILRK